MIIGLIGLIGSGKSTVGELLKKDHGFTPEAFAKPLKDAVSIIFGWDRKLLEGDTDESRRWRDTVDDYWAKELNKPEFTPRLALQWMGTEAGRQIFGNNLWTSSLINRLDLKKNYVITDVRFENEIYALNKIAGAHIVRVKRGPDPEWMQMAIMYKQNRYLPEIREHIFKQLPHISEWDWCNSHVEMVIKNDYSLDSLKSIVAKVVEFFK